MKNIRSVAKVSLLILLVAVSGCGKDKEKSGQAATPQAGQPSPVAAKAGQPAGKGALVASPQDEADAAVAKEQVIKLLRVSDFSGIYRLASAGFREVGPVEQFNLLWQKQLQETGAFKDVKEVSHSVRPSDGFLQFTYLVQYAYKNKELRLTFGRSKQGKLELTGINQREPAKK